jgi:hypothetical protein
MNTLAYYAIALIIVYFILYKGELYQNIVLDDKWNESRNKPKRVSDPLNSCSPESHSECIKVKMPHLSRY